MNEDTQEQRAMPDAKREKSNPLLLATLVLALGWMLVQWTEAQAEEERPWPAAPELVVGAVGDCAVPASQAEKRATELLIRARARWERAAFAPDVALAALHDAKQAAVCFDRASVEHARDAERLADAIGVQTQRSYERLQLKLRVALKREDATTAVRAIGDLRALLRDDRGPYGRWLLERQQELAQQQRSQGGAP